MIDHNGTQAAIRAGYSPHTAGSQAFDLLKKPEIVARIAALEDEARRKLTIEHQDVLARYWEKATANPADLVQLRRVACRYCYGADHRYQWTTERELREAQDAALLATYPSEAIEAMADRLEAGERVPGVPTGEGGFGYNATALPNMACPECSGQGVASVHLADTREAINHPLFEGVKATQHGIEVKIGSRADALEKVARHLQFFNDKIQLGADEALLAAARAINQETPPVTPDYIAENSARLLDGDDT